MLFVNRDIIEERQSQVRERLRRSYHDKSSDASLNPPVRVYSPPKLVKKPQMIRMFRLKKKENSTQTSQQQLMQPPQPV